MTNCPQKLILATTGAAVVASIACAAALAGWGVAGNAYVAVEYPARDAHVLCTNAARLHIAIRPEPFIYPAFVSSHPYDWVRIRLTASATPPTQVAAPPQNPIVADAIVALPRSSIYVNGNVYAYSGFSDVFYTSALPAGAKYLQVWPVPWLGELPGNIGKGGALPLDPTCRVLPPPTSGCFGARPTISGTPGDDVITGTPGPDVIFAGAGNDTVNALGGDDLVCGGPGNDKLTGGDGNDALDGGDGNDQLAGSTGNDLLVGGASADSLDGSFGDDILLGGAGDDQLTGKVPIGEYLEGFDALDGGPGTDSCHLGNVLVGCAP
jgi:RTX calcium-binding nonapeptide repeat (4 copies)